MAAQLATAKSAQMEFRKLVAQHSSSSKAAAAEQAKAVPAATRTLEDARGKFLADYNTSKVLLKTVGAQ